MSESDRIAEARAAGAREERSAILAIVEQHLRQVAHGHGADGAWVLEHLLAELSSRETGADAASGSAG